MWVESHTNIALPRYKTMKHKLLAAGLGTPDMTENDIMESLGYTKVYDCGNLRFTWTPSLKLGEKHENILSCNKI